MSKTGLRAENIDEVLKAKLREPADQPYQGDLTLDIYKGVIKYCESFQESGV